MARPHFEFISPKTLAEAIGMLKKYGKDARLMAGGTDLLLQLKRGAIQAKVIIGLKNIKDLNLIVFHPEKGLTIGATALLADVAVHPDIRKHYPSIASAAKGTANVQVRNMGTVIGNLCNASPSADNAPMLLVLGAMLNIIGPDGERRLPLNEFFKGPGITALGKNEIVVSVDVPLPEKNTGTTYLSFSARGQVDCTAVGVGVKLAMDGRKCKDAKMVIGACAPVPMRVEKAEKTLKGHQLSDARIERAARIAVEEIQPITDVRASATYRSKVVEILVKRALLEAWKKVK